jgi:asparagine synthase (glutamine-hydrolysing)
MSIIFGLRKPEGDLVDERQLLEIAQTTERWAPDGTFVRAEGRIGMGFQPYHTHQRSILQSHPVVDELANMVTLDGRLDNHKELRELLDIGEDTPDSLIALAAFKRWGEDCFSRFVGDWALAIWSQVDRSLYLARDHAGTRTLYFEIKNGNIVWATFLEAFFVEDKSRQLDEAYASCYLACQPIRDLTPYKGIVAVTPAHYILIRENDAVRQRHWCCTPKEYIKYSTSQEYEEHFFSLLALSVSRRTTARMPILAHLSGGMDSSSIVCMSDYLQQKQGVDRRELIDTVSYYDNSDPAWDETPYFTCVEEVRNKRGIHIDASTIDHGLDRKSDQIAK